MSKLKTSVKVPDNPTDYYSPSLSKKITGTFRRTFQRPGAVGMFNKKSVTHIFSPEKPLKTPAIKEDFLTLSTTMESMTRNFPGNTRFVVAQEAMQHLKENIITFQNIFADFNIPESGYQLLAGFDEDFIRGRLGYVNQIHILLHSEPQEMDIFLMHLSPVLKNFTAVVFTKKSTYRLPPIPEEFRKIALVNIVYGLSTLSQADAGGSFDIGGPSGQGNNGSEPPDDSKRKGKEREDPPIPPDCGKEGDSDKNPDPPGPDTGDAKSADLRFRVSADLLQRDVSFQSLQIQGALRIKRTPESKDPCQFATWNVEFTELRTTNKSLESEISKYRQFQLNARISVNEDDFVIICKSRPLSTPEYNFESKVSKGSKKIWSVLGSGSLSLLPPKATVGGSGSRTGEKATNTERTANISRIEFTNIRGVSEWTYHLIDGCNQVSGLTLSPEKLPHGHIIFGGDEAAPPPPSTHLNVEISTYWTILPPGGGTGSGQGSSKPMFSNLCNVVALNLPKVLQRSHLYTANLLVQLDANPITSRVKNVVQDDLGKAIVAETNHTANTSN